MAAWVCSEEVGTILHTRQRDWSTAGGQKEKSPDPSRLLGEEAPTACREREQDGKKPLKRRPLVFIFPWNGIFEA